MSQYDDEYEDDDYVVNPDDWDLDDKFNSVIQKKNEEKSDEIQSKIQSQIYFKHNSVNLVIGKRGSGKTYFVMREMYKLAQMMHYLNLNLDPKHKMIPRYTQIYYITDKLRDDTCERIKKLIEKNIPEVQFIWDSTEHAFDIIQYIAAIKAFLADPTQYDEKFQNLEFINQCKDVLHIDPNLPNNAPLPHTVIIFDDCIGLFNKYSPLSKKLFENRQTRITYFLLLQDVQGINPSMKANVDSLIFFGGFPKHKWNSLMYQMPVVNDLYTFDTAYHRLSSKDFVLFDYIDNKIYEKSRNSKFMPVFGSV